ncbi:hypothetical protein CDD80_7004 [Ophiocordyceps camponoti-rufipedis]|uniref:Chromosome transmission fidelity protein 8 n=1 Tax=Ophiocordyceps camponoti-rufipedis TaxID=2004952 RepID=A0A2C5XT89_9HYPO|nr:hypothetical protein CDD80_7004 [Ophiocordyceps camponoti-rufipedis]
MAPVKLYARRPEPASQPSIPQSGLPPVLQTPSGLALLEIQGTLNVSSEAVVEMGRLEFPDGADGDDTSWMKRVYLYVGRYQRLEGEVEKLPAALAVVRRREDEPDGQKKPQAASLEVVDIIKYKLIFSNRPEPVNTANTT